MQEGRAPARNYAHRIRNLAHTFRRHDRKASRERARSVSRAVFPGFYFALRGGAQISYPRLKPSQAVCWLPLLCVGLTSCTTVSKDAHYFAGNLSGFVNNNTVARQQYSAVLKSDEIHHPGNVVGDWETLGWYDGNLGRPEEVIYDHEQALKFCRQQGDIFGAAASLNLLAVDYLKLENRPDEALTYSRSALGLFHMVRTPLGRWNEGDCLINLGTIYDALNQYGNAIDCFERAVAIFREFPAGKIRVTDALGWLGTEYNTLGQPAKALIYFKQSLDLQPGPAQTGGSLLQECPAKLLRLPSGNGH